MKKGFQLFVIYILIAIPMLWLLAWFTGKFPTQPVRAAAGQQSSYYAATFGNDTGLILPYKHMELFNSSMFDTASTGIVILQDDMFIANNYSGLIKLTGSCYQVYPGSSIHIYINTNAGMFLVASGVDQFFDFTFVTASPWLQIGAATFVQSYDLLKCALLFEAVG